ncbi:MerR family transcriptional regulator [Bacillus sp. FJAT-49736]|uniref:MerR family transcriptional regulator n=1 Tax=Bacillus sp. FJAT-49736 TaxID=2833582 RepID=UPI001BC956F9|nr:MerR family transcriptional regulator [Bacillus sp. FJAT-49736]MBS4174312.1 MerR family transcriptional regulator [Bacillus sp. FJAT-49736]
MIHSDPNGWYTIQQVADLTGLSKQVIRKWEERYLIIQPSRQENGYRIYSTKDVHILLNMKLLTEQGHTVKQASTLIKDMVDDPPILLDKDISIEYEYLNEYVFRLLEKGKHCDELELNFILKQSYHHLGLDPFLSTVVIPFLKEVGNKWEKKEWDEFQESVSSLVVRDFLVQIRRNYQYRENAPFVLGACLPYEQHEVPVHLVLMQFMLKGWKTQLIGASPAPGAIESLVLKLKPDVVILSASTTTPFETDSQIIKSLDQFAENHKEIQFYLGGYGAVSYFANNQPRAIKVTNSVEDIL